MAKEEEKKKEIEQIKDELEELDEQFDQEENVDTKQVLSEIISSLKAQEEQEMNRLKEEIGNITINDVIKAIETLKKFKIIINQIKEVEKTINEQIKELSPEQENDLQSQLIKMLLGKFKL